MVKRLLQGAVMALLGIFVAEAEIPAGYYDGCEGKSGKSLLQAVGAATSSGYNSVGYDGLWTVYRTSDVRPDGTIWDMYSTAKFTLGTSQCGNYKKVGDCYNREHSFPKSWFSKASPMVSDAFHIYPTDGKVNGQRSNHPYGECANGSQVASNGSVKPLGKLGTSTFAGYSGTVFEPDDQYKGDFARSYFYMAARYNDRIAGWNSDMLAHNNYPCFTSWALELLLKWHRQDPVSQKELDRNDAVYVYQHNRNPFIDHPELVEHIWGDKKTESWTPGGDVAPRITSPVDGSSVKFGVVSLSNGGSAEVVVRGVALDSDVAVTVSGTGFGAQVSRIPAASAMSDNGYRLLLTCRPVAAGTMGGWLELRSGDVAAKVTLEADVVDGLCALDATGVSESSFTARWLDLSIDPSDRYSLWVGTGGDPVEGYPRQVLAADEKYEVTGLEPSTVYTYYVSDGDDISNHVEVTTATPVPMLALMYDGELYFTAEPGVPSEPAEFMIDSEYVYGDVTVAVGAPFELSTDRSQWSRSVVLGPEEDRFYLRLNSSQTGTYVVLLEASAEGCEADEAELTGVVGNAVNFIEDFENANTGGYTPAGVYVGSAASWVFTNGNVFNNYKYEGKQSFRFSDKTNTGSAMMVSDKRHGAGVVTFYTRGWSEKEGDGTIELYYSNNGGLEWQQAGEVNVTYGTGWAEHSIPVNCAGDVRLDFRKVSGLRLQIDYVTVSDYASSSVNELEYHSWDAFCRGGRLVVVSDGDCRTVTVYGVDGIVRHSAPMASGETEIDLAPGLYLVAVDDFVRRVVVKK